MTWHYAKNGVKFGPVTSTELKRLASSGNLAPSDLVWKDGMNEWRPAIDVQGLFEGKASKGQASSTQIPRGVADAVDAKGLRPTGTILDMADRLSDATGVEKLDGFSLSEMFSETFSRHSPDDVERYFNVGGPDTTPPIEAIETSWPKPWAFFRTLMFSGILYGGLLLMWEQFKYKTTLPGLVMVGSFAVPIATVVLFFELNVRKNISIFQVVRWLLLGGVLSLIATGMNNMFIGSKLDFLGASVAGLTEEPAKLLILILVVNDRRYPYILNGMLFGAAIGAGFAAFETAGYAFFATQDIDSAKGILLMRGILSPFAHIAWTAMSAAALWRVKGSNPFRFRMLIDHRFVRVFVAAIILHMLWNTSWELPIFPIGKHLVLGVVSWIILLGLVQEGLKQVRFEKQAKLALQQSA